MNDVRTYIFNNWKNTFHLPHEMKGDFRVPKPYISPSIGGRYTDLYYWDTYFTNLGLLEDGFFEQVENNLENMAWFIDTLGYVPNANTLSDRSQPPLFCSAVYEYYQYKSDVSILKKFVPFALKEYEFWKTQRQATFGLNRFFTNADDKLKMLYYEGLHQRVCEQRNTTEQQLSLAEDIMSIAESGLDFHIRFRTERSKLDANCFLQLDANCFLYEMESKIAKMLAVIGENPKPFMRLAKTRRQRIQRYLYDRKQKIYLDYNFVDHKFSNVISAVSLYPYAYGISKNKRGLQKVIQALEYEHGIAFAPYRGEDTYYQWDYPCMWPPVVYLAFKALKRLRLFDDTKRIAEKYIRTVEANFSATGKLWEKYDAVNGGVGQSNEYETPEMMGWTAGVYVRLCEELKTL